jgi:dihydroxyacetone kinase-like protein
MPLSETPQIIVAMAEGIAHRGKAAPGQKTMLDAWAPAAAAIGAGPLRADIAAARQAAQSGAKATTDMIATIGRAALLGERSRGHPDPGAASAAMLITVFCDQIEQLAQALDIR